jgi:hypothetical protein
MHLPLETFGFARAGGGHRGDQAAREGERHEIEKYENGEQPAQHRRVSL